MSEVNFIKSFGRDVIITDHHEAQEILPEAFAIINPKAKNSLVPDLDFETIESLNCLAGVGVAFKLACALLEKYDLKPEESLFFDDRPENIEGGKRCGIDGIVVTGQELLIDELEKLIAQRS